MTQIVFCGRRPPFRNCPVCGSASTVPLGVNAGIEEAKLGRGRHVLVSAVAVITDTDRENAYKMFVAIDDIDNRALTEREARKQLEATIAVLPAGKP